MIIIHAFINVKSEQREEFLELAKQVAAPSKAEEGNISYHFYEDPEQPGNFVFVEKWKDQPAIKYHEETSHFKKFFEGIEELLRTPVHVELYSVSEKH
jgi:quinol monooxygenase YgiN